MRSVRAEATAYDIGALALTIGILVSGCATQRQSPALAPPQARATVLAPASQASPTITGPHPTMAGSAIPLPATPPLLPSARSPSGPCTRGALTEGAAREQALAYASGERFSGARVIAAELLSFDELRDDHGLTPSCGASCYWYVEMSGFKLRDRWGPGTFATPTPGPGNTWVKMTVVLDADTGFQCAGSFSTVQLGTPTPPTPGAYPSMMPPPTLPVPVNTPARSQGVRVQVGGLASSALGAVQCLP